ncbi:YdeI/OmpD-associated family protein [Mucilaginibacter arboris]|nr:YdeI/OmpD-associated family protein [Mucilaginibacter arboris]
MDTAEINSLAKKLLIKTAQHWLFINPPEGFADSFAQLNVKAKTIVSPEEKFDGVLLFLKNSTELKQGLPKIISALKPETVAWIAYPKKSSGIISDLEMTGNWQETEKYGLQVVSAASIDKTWTALRLRPKEQVKESKISNDAIQNNELNQFIDTKNRIVYLPEDVKQALEKEPDAFSAYEKLAYSHKKEYLVWILTAKQEKTRTSRVQKMIEKLLETKQV